MKCKFCGCTDNRPCLIPMAETPDGQDQVLAIGPAVISTFVMPCQWLARDICSAPTCVDLAYTESRARMLELEIESLEARWVTTAA